jgi:hypothetical protein
MFGPAFSYLRDALLRTPARLAAQQEIVGTLVRLLGVREEQAWAAVWSMIPIGEERLLDTPEGRGVIGGDAAMMIRYAPPPILTPTAAR